MTMKTRVLAVTLAVAVSVVLLSVGPALSCDKEGNKACDCAAFKDNVKRTLLEVEGGFLVTFEVTGTDDEIKKAADLIAAEIDGCGKGTCDCKAAKSPCPFAIEGLKFEVGRIDKGVQVTVTGGCPGRRAAFKKGFEGGAAAGFGCDKPEEGEGDKACGCAHEHDHGEGHECSHKKVEVDQPCDCGKDKEGDKGCDCGKHK